MAAWEPIRPPEFSDLETFVLAVEEGSIARAAGRLRISGPAAGKRIRQLEVLAHDRLLDRGRRGVSATEAGAGLHPVARELWRTEAGWCGRYRGLIRCGSRGYISSWAAFLCRAPPQPDLVYGEHALAFDCGADLLDQRPGWPTQLAFDLGAQLVGGLGRHAGHHVWVGLIGVAASGQQLEHLEHGVVQPGAGAGPLTLDGLRDSRGDVLGGGRESGGG